MKTALVAGGTGLIGSQLLELLLERNRYSKVIVITRKELPAHPKLVQLRMEFDKIEESTEGIKADDVFCCPGTTMAKAKSKEKFYQVDFTYPLLLAKHSLKLNAKQYLLVSAIGANKSSAVYYNRVKGEIEEAITSSGFETVHIFRPSLLLGPRKEPRAGEDAAKIFYKVFGFLIPKKYKGIESLKIAKAMLHFASQDQKGIFFHESAEMQNF